MLRQTRSMLLVAVTLGMLFAASVPTASAQTTARTHRVVFDMSGQAIADWDLLFEQIGDLQRVFGAGEIQIEVVVQDSGVGWLMGENTSLQNRLRQAADGGVAFVIGEGSLKRRRLARHQLLPFVQVVDSGVVELVRKQEDGWAYIRSTPEPVAP
ncbi:MAG TPA: DsrE family protein [Tepidisphaeraceae bacterium]|nr:DsrE family protein [Tepidisphaeraceae bacterium]